MSNVFISKQSKDVWRWSILSVIVFSLITHGYRFSNNMYSHDSLLMIYQNDYGWQIALGRFVQPMLIFLRGSLCNPWLISVCAVFWSVLSTYFLTRLLDINHVVGVILTAGVLVCNTTMIVANASYLPWVDFYALAGFCGILGIWCLRQGITAQSSSSRINTKTLWWYVIGILVLVCSMGIYQSYICVAIGLAILDIFSELMKKAEWKKFVRKAICYVLALVVVALLYYAIWKIFQKVFGIWTANSYNGLASVGDYSDTSIISVLINTYRQVFDFLWNPDTFKSVIYKSFSMSYIWKWLLRLANILIICDILYQVVVTNIRQKTALWQRALQLILLLIFPFGINFVSFISKGMEHTLMIFAFSLIYVLSLQQNNRSLSVTANNYWVKFFIILPFALLIWSNVVYANQIYLKKELQEEATLSLMTRVVSDIEDIEGYIAGETPVAFYGNFQTSDYVQELIDFEEITPYGMGKSTVTYIGADYSMLKYQLNVNMNLTRVDSADEDVLKQIKAMPCYPNQGSIDYIDDILVIKIADF